MSNADDWNMKDADVLATNALPYARAFLPFKAVRLAALDRHDKPVLKSVNGKWGAVVASGFLMRETNGLYLYTCWHVVTGIDPHNADLPGLIAGERRAALRVRMQASERLESGGAQLGGIQEFDVTLFDTSQSPPSPLWEQDERCAENATLELANLVQPHGHDVVRIRLPASIRPPPLQVITWPEVGDNFIYPGDSVMLVGYPYGYSALKDQPTPVVLTRTIAATMTEGSRRREILLDGEGAPGMSGGPVFFMSGKRMHLLGMYTGVLYPEGQQSAAIGAVCVFHRREMNFVRPQVPRPR